MQFSKNTMEKLENHKEIEKQSQENRDLLLGKPVNIEHSTGSSGEDDLYYLHWGDEEIGTLWDEEEAKIAKELLLTEKIDPHTIGKITPYATEEGVKEFLARVKLKRAERKEEGEKSKATEQKSFEELTEKLKVQLSPEEWELLKKRLRTGTLPM